MDPVACCKLCKDTGILYVPAEVAGYMRVAPCVWAKDGKLHRKPDNKDLKVAIRCACQSGCQSGTSE